ncbi:response regulator (plasmid) [Pseudomonas sp. HR96]|uniref:response regulator n=1 Tax=Pseudomonas sp. HR96 TaxID=1027966 RepID=UPI002A74E807|nr:response regulator [Pseudomonas sp. HR96]WPP02516.1 response regulator [Pseudomonas sp. HR96]
MQTQSQSVTLLTTDLKMPGQIDGVDLVARVHQKIPKAPIVVASGYHSDSDVLHIDRVYWLPKPFTLAQLNETYQLLVPHT